MTKLYKILLVDDEQAVLNSLERVLRKKEYEILLAKSAEEAGPILECCNIDLLICDHQLTGMSGIDFLNRTSRSNRDLIAILLTAHADLKLAVDAINRTCLYKFILKPWDDDDLKVTVARALEQRDLVLENRRLCDEIKKRDLIFRQLEGRYPGISQLKRGKNGEIILDDNP